MNICHVVLSMSNRESSLRLEFFVSRWDVYINCFLSACARQTWEVGNKPLFYLVMSNVNFKTVFY